MGIGPAQQPLPERHSSVIACGFAIKAPENLREWRDRADLAIRVRIDSQTALSVEGGASRDEVVTAHEATVLELFKGDVRGVVEGASQQVLQLGGRVRLSDAMLTQTWNSFPPMPVGTEWVLFLNWSEHHQGFMPLLLEHGAVQIIDGKVAPKSSLHRDWNGRPAEEFIAAIRR